MTTPFNKNETGLHVSKVRMRVRLRRMIFGVQHERKHPRYDCFLLAPMFIPERKLTLNGAIKDISQGGVLWREASNYILDRRGLTVRISIMGVWHEGTIVVVAPRGYSIRFNDKLEEGLAYKLANEYPRPSAEPNTLLSARLASRLDEKALLSRELNQ